MSPIRSTYAVYNNPRSDHHAVPSASRIAPDAHRVPSAETRTTAILRVAKEQKDALDSVSKRKRFQFRKRSKMPFKLRMVVFSVVFGIMLLSYLLDFFAGGSLGVAANAWTDSLAENGAHIFCATAADLTGTDWSGRELALFRLLTLGPISFTLFCFTVSLIVTGVIATIWSYKATKRSEDDGTSNFLPEKVGKSDRTA